MGKTRGIVFQSDQVRAWVDEENIGHVRMIRRVNFSTLITVIRKVVEAEGEVTHDPRQVRMYIPSSLKAVESENLRSLIEFSETCCNLRIVIVETDNS